jgi:hypothetical protein
VLLGVLLALLGATAVVAPPGLASDCGPAEAGCHSVRLGVNDNWDARHYQAADLEPAHDAQLRLLRFPWSWAQTQPTGPDDWNWAYTDRIMAAAQAAGEKVIFKPQGSPCWARPAVPCSAQGTVPPAAAYLPYWRDYVRAVIERYGDSIAAVEVWNEPNLWWYWSAPIAPRRYAHLLRVTYDAVKSVDPQMTVVYGGLSSAASTAAGRMEYGRFLAASLENGAANHFDALAIHPYAPAPAEPGYLDRVDAILRRVRAVAQAHGMPGIPLWVTEFGYPSSGGLSEEAQAQQLVATLHRFARTPGVQVAIIHRMYDPLGAAPKFGLLDRLGNTKPAYCAVSQWAGGPPCPAAP